MTLKFQHNALCLFMMTLGASLLAREKPATHFNRPTPNARLTSIGHSHEGRDIYLWIVGSGPKKILFLSGQHGDELLGVEVVETFLREVMKPTHARLLKNITAFIIPRLNPDALSSLNRLNAQGIDLNRDYPHHQKSSPPMSPEVCSLLSLMNENLFLTAIDVHAGSQAILWPYGHTPNATAHESFFLSLAEATAGKHSSYFLGRSFFDYPTWGEFIDFAYAAYGTFALTYEVSQKKNIPNNPGKRAIIAKGSQNLMNFAYQTLQFQHRVN